MGRPSTDEGVASAHPFVESVRRQVQQDAARQHEVPAAKIGLVQRRALLREVGAREESLDARRAPALLRRRQAADQRERATRLLDVADHHGVEREQVGEDEPGFDELVVGAEQIAHGVVVHSRLQRHRELLDDVRISGFEPVGARQRRRRDTRKAHLDQLVAKVEDRLSVVGLARRDRGQRRQLVARHVAGVLQQRAQRAERAAGIVCVERRLRGGERLCGRRGGGHAGSLTVGRDCSSSLVSCRACSTSLPRRDAIPSPRGSVRRRSADRRV
jgi:hypothetical protein